MIKYNKVVNLADDIGALEGLGLSENEAKIYLCLIKEGPMKASSLAKRTGFQRCTVYDALSQLERKGMAGKSELSGIATFFPSPPSSLYSFLDEKRDSLDRLVPNLSRSFESETKASVSVMHGVSGMKTVLEDILSLKADFCVYYGQLQIFDYLPKFFPIFNEKRKKLGIKARFILLDLPKVRERAKRVPFAEFKFIDPSTVSGGVWWTYSDRLVLYVLQNEPITMMIRNAELAKTFQKTFDSEFASKTAVYRGHLGMKAFFERTLSEKEVLLIGGSGQAPQNYPEYFDSHYAPQARLRGIEWKVLAHRVIVKTRAVSHKFINIRFLPKSLASSPYVVWVFGDCVANVVWLDEPVAFLVEDARMAKIYRDYFFLLWRASEPL
jgi:sugar-specific transcriptional regulator TrmB